MKSSFVFIALCMSFCFITPIQVKAQNQADKANTFIQSLDAAQRTKALYPFDTEERYRFVYVPVDDRKGISVNELNPAQQRFCMDLLNSCLSQEAVKKVSEIMQLEILLKELENRLPEDHHRDPGKYFITIFGVPSDQTIWGWRFEGHHIAFNFSADKNQLVATTPNFLGTNPAIVLSGPQKGKEILKEETARGFALVQALSAEELKKALISTTAPAEIITGNSRRAMIEHPQGIRYNELSPAHQQLLLQLISVYIHRYTKLFADDMLKDIQTAGLDKLWFTWAGATEHAIGKPHYYRIQGPTIIIEYDNIQNNANHVHTTVRDLKSDFGGDELLEHYKKGH
jgi:Protein of unknown function (DUF3500)